MKKLVLGAFVAAAMATAYTPAFAGPEAPGPDGVLCGFTSVTDPGTEGGDVQTGEVDGGPIIGDGTLTCTIQVGASQHSGPDAASASASGTGVVVLPPTVVSYVSPEGVPVYLCTQWTDANGTVYWHPSEDPDGIPGSGDESPGHWTADANKPCGLATSASSGDVTDEIWPIVDPIICPVLAQAFPPHGDIPEIGWDCPPYNA